MAVRVTFTLRDQDAALSEEEVREVVSQAWASHPTPRITLGGIATGMVLFVEPEVEVEEPSEPDEDVRPDERYEMGI